VAVSELERWLASHREELLTDQSPPGAHVSEAFLIEALQGRKKLDEAALGHLARCSECRHVTRELALEVNEDAPVRIRPLPIIGVLAAAAVLAVLFVSPPREYGEKGAPADDAASVTLLAVNKEGVEREARDGATLGLDERLGFRYGNPRGERKTLTVLGWDGRELHWYYPESPNEKPFELRSGSDARNLRLPFDIQLAEKHRAGMLRVIAAFDVDPSALARSVREDRVKESTTVKVFRLTIAAGGAR
jgi:hypothetical protein